MKFIVYGVLFIASLTAALPAVDLAEKRQEACSGQACLTVSGVGDDLCTRLLIF